MTTAIAARQNGDEWQAFLFWKEALHMVVAKEIERVGFEVDDFKAFDDVAVRYKADRADGTGEAVCENYYQVKFSTTYAKRITADALIDPAFINATSVSLLQRLRDAVRKCTSETRNARLHLVSPWPIGDGDILVDLVDTSSGALRLGILFDGTGKKSRMGKLRESWKEHLEITSDDALHGILKPFRIRIRPSTLEEARRDLNLGLLAIGCSLVPDLTVTNPYSQLIWKASAGGQQWFDVDQILGMCRSEGLCEEASPPVPERGAKTIGVRTFMRWAENLEDETDAMICLTCHFSQRHIRDSSLWKSAVLPELLDFFNREVTAGATIELSLQCHSSLAFASGYLIEPKAGVQVGVLQRGIKGMEVWRLQPETKDVPGGEVVVNEYTLGNERTLACAVGVTHEISSDVVKFLSAKAFAGCLMNVTIPKTNSTAVKDGAHAYQLAEAIMQAVRAKRSEFDDQPLEIFISAPSGLAFLLGQLSRTLGAIQLHEFDFDGTREYSTSALLDPLYALGATRN